MEGVNDGSGTKPRWWAVRPAHNPKPATYGCPLCGKHLPACVAKLGVEIPGVLGSIRMTAFVG
jgi:hypothetical protein